MAITTRSVKELALVVVKDVVAQVKSTVVTSLTDPWMSAANAQRWAARWGSTCINAGNAGHINVESGHGPWPFARRWVMRTEQRLSRHLPPVRPSMVPWQFAV